MQLLSFTAGGQTYAIEAGSVVEVLPAVPVRPLPAMPDYVLGVVAYRGTMIPVIDVPRRLAGEPAGNVDDATGLAADVARPETP